MPLPTDIYSAAQVRARDRDAIENRGIAGYTLMTRAAQAALDVLRQQWPRARQVRVLCGSGNNGGDGYALARLARAQGLDVAVMALIPSERLRGDARRAYDDCRAAGVPIGAFDVGQLAVANLMVDAIFGIGLDRPVDPVMAAVIDAVNRCAKPVLALDVPSGLHADTGQVMGTAVRATHTVSFVGLKVGCFVGAGLAHCGELHFSDLGIPELHEGGDPPVLERLDESLLATLLPRRVRDAHKGVFGHVLIVGGGLGMPGAVRLSGEACLRAGAGLVSIGTRAENLTPIVAGRPELMVHGVEPGSRLRELTAQADVIVVGPGLGRDDWARRVLDEVLASERPLVVDADGLNLLATSPQRRNDWILTPHPGEAGRLLGLSTVEVQDDRRAALASLIERFGGVAVLKGAGTLVGTAGYTPAVCAYGNPGMATAGVGDVLSGVMGALLAQLRDPWSAARAAVLAHALAGDLAARQGQRGLIASDLFEPLRACLNP
jgi:ADP-dependent NAD(P)H-hydrate dehydratase / NAD(P)H-hydrate epimerase